jgi:hypothetical protein
VDDGYGDDDEDDDDDDEPPCPVAFSDTIYDEDDDDDVADEDAPVAADVLVRDRMGVPALYSAID